MTTEEAIANGNGNIVERIRKLLRLARNKGATEGEAANALAMAQRLMLKHNIDNVEEKVEEVAVRGDWHKFDVDKKWQQCLVSAVAKLFNCRSLQSGTGNGVQFIGKPSNVLVAADTLQWINDQMHDLYKQARKGFQNETGLRHGDAAYKLNSRNFRLNFKEACALRIWYRVNDIVAAARNEIPSHMALVVIDQALAAADDIVAGLGIKASGKGLTLRNSGLGAGAGRAAGDQVKLQHSVKGETRGN